jgi:SAM-dependent methyltransferase
LLKSCVCKAEQLSSDEFRAWFSEIREPFRLHRKFWEFAYIAQCLEERGMLQPGRRGLGFGVGREPLAAVFANRGCAIVATDLTANAATRLGWAQSNQHASALETLNERRICDPVAFTRLVQFRNVDMNAIPDDLAGFDFTWSSCCFEHLGSIANGARFIEQQMNCLKPGGIAVHTTELNLSSDRETIDNNPVIVLFRRTDLMAIARRLARLGHKIDLDLTLGDQVADNFIDVPPYQNEHCLRIEWDRFVTTSVGLVIQKRTSHQLGHSVAGWWRTIGRRRSNELSPTWERESA